MDDLGIINSEISLRGDCSPYNNYAFVVKAVLMQETKLISFVQDRLGSSLHARLKSWERPFSWGEVRQVGMLQEMISAGGFFDRH